jgi:hypothetical protein
MTAKSWAEVETKVAELERELEVYKKALKLMAKAKLFERMEQVYEDDIEKEVAWFLGMAERAKARKELKNGKELRELLRTYVTWLRRSW